MKSCKTNFPYVECKDLGNDNYLHLINIEKIDLTLEKFIDENIVNICAGNADTDLCVVKKRLINFLTPKKGKTSEMGSIAEFFTHLYLKEIGFNQEFLFLNLEEESLKKGFDGYYSYQNETWIYESKSGSSNTKDISHPKKVKESYNDLNNKISGNTKNNPWQNAYNHARHGDVGSSADVYKKLNKLSEEFTNKKFHNIKDFNIIPGSTIFMNGNWLDIKLSDIEPEIESLVSKFNFKKIHIICVNKKSMELFWDYLNK